MLEHGQLQLLIKPCNQHMFNWMKPVGLLIKGLSNQSYNGWPSAGDVTNEEHQPKPPKPAVLQWLMRYLTTKSWLSWLAENRWKPWFWVGFEASWSSFNMVFVQSWMDYWSVMSKKKDPNANKQQSNTSSNKPCKPVQKLLHRTMGQPGYVIPVWPQEFGISKKTWPNWSLKSETRKLIKPGKHKFLRDSLLLLIIIITIIIIIIHHHHQNQHHHHHHPSSIIIIIMIMVIVPINQHWFWGISPMVSDVSPNGFTRRLLLLNLHQLIQGTG